MCIAVLACALSSPAVAGTVQGVAAYRERIALPPDAVFEAVLQDVSRADAPAQVLGRARLAPAGQPPFKFEITYDDGDVTPGHRYTVRATVTSGRRLLFTTDRSYPVLDGGSAPLQLRLVSVARGQASQRPLRNTYWKLVRLGDAPVEVAEQQPEPHLVLAMNQLRVSGSGGCNRLSGAFLLEGNTLSFRSMAGTMKACPEGMEQETRFLQTLGQVRAFRIDGNHLELLDEAGEVLARFEAVDLR
jgi:putative lipoprotein